MLFFAALALLPAPVQAVVWEPYEFNADGAVVACQLGRMKVPENRERAGSNEIELAFVRLKSTAENPGPPIVYLDGGPGSSAISLARSGDYMKVFQRLRGVADVILLDQRSVGLSRPNLTYIPPEPIAEDALVSRESFLNAYRPRVRAAIEHFKAKGVDLDGYTTLQSAHDVDDLRKALGVEKVSLVGFSYGTHLTQACIKYHGANIHRAALIGTEGLNHTRKLPSTSDAQVERLNKMIQEDPELAKHVPDFGGLLKRVFAKLEKEPITVEVTSRLTGKKVPVKIGKFGLQFLLLTDFGDTRDLIHFPKGLYELDKGNDQAIAGLAEKRYNQWGIAVPMMFVVMDFSSGASKARDEQIQREAETAVFGNAMNLFFPEMGREFGLIELGDDFRSPIVTTVPSLFVSGTLDNNTQPFQADEVRRTFKTSTHIVVENAGHEDMLVHPTIQDAIARYLQGQDVSDVRLTLPKLKFTPIQ